MNSRCKVFKISKNKYIEIQLDLFPENDWKLFNIEISQSLKGDHAGFRFEISCYYFFYFSFIVYDCRHWNWEKDRWEEYNDKIDED